MRVSTFDLREPAISFRESYHMDLRKSARLQIERISTFNLQNSAFSIRESLHIRLAGIKSINLINSAFSIYWNQPL